MLGAGAELGTRAAADRDLSTEASHALNARLVLLLANHVGDLDVLKQALALARASGETN